MAVDGKRAPGMGADGDVAHAVQRAKIELERMIDLTPQIMLLVDARGCITRANLAFLRLLGVAEFSAVLGRTMPDFFDVAEEGFFEALPCVEGGYGTRESRAVTKGGRTGMFRFTVVGVGGDEDTRVVIVEDITAETEQAVRAEREHKKDAVRALAGGLMHRINQRLTVITVRAKLMLMALEKDRVRVDELKKALGDITTLSMEIAQILDRLGDQKDFVTESYLEGMDILDLERSSGKGVTEC